MDTSVLLDVLGADPVHGKRSREALRSAYDTGALVACEVVWAEVRAHFKSDSAFAEALDLLGVRFDPISTAAAAKAGGSAASPVPHVCGWWPTCSSEPMLFFRQTPC